MLTVHRPADETIPESRPLEFIDEFRLLYSPLDVANRAGGRLLSLDQLIAFAAMIDHARTVGYATPDDGFRAQAVYRRRDADSPTGVRLAAGAAMADDAEAAMITLRGDAKATQELRRLGFRFDALGMGYRNPHKPREVRGL
jgi:hypothetical protein